MPSSVYQATCSAMSSASTARVDGADRLDAELPVLAVAPPLHRVVAEHRGRRSGRRTGSGSRVMPRSRYARTTGAVPSGRSVSGRSALSWKEYISFCTTSEPSPRCAANSAGVLERRRHDLAIAGALERLDARAATTRRRSALGAGSQSSVRDRALEPRRSTAHRPASRNGFVARSRPSVVAGP